MARIVAPSPDTKSSNKIPPFTLKVKNDYAPQKTTLPPFLSLQISNPVTYIRAWWKKLIGNEGVKVTLQIKPITAFILMIIFSSAGFGFGRLTLPAPIEKYIFVTPSPTPIPTPDPWRDTAFSGKVQLTGERYYLVTTSAEAITLNVPQTINLKPLVGKRLLVAGRYNKDNKTMVVTATTDLEILPSSPQPIPTSLPIPSPVTPL